jgi:hypothetical protein
MAGRKKHHQIVMALRNSAATHEGDDKLHAAATAMRESKEEEAARLENQNKRKRDEIEGAEGAAVTNQSTVAKKLHTDDSANVQKGTGTEATSMEEGKGQDEDEPDLTLDEQKKLDADPVLQKTVRFCIYALSRFKTQVEALNKPQPAPPAAASPASAVPSPAAPSSHAASFPPLSSFPTPPPSSSASSSTSVSHQDASTLPPLPPDPALRLNLHRYHHVVRLLRLLHVQPSRVDAAVEADVLAGEALVFVLRQESDRAFALLRAATRSRSCIPRDFRIATGDAQQYVRRQPVRVCSWDVHD